ncbi:uncharacterized protein LOC114848289 [Betta splendens]|uniref:S100P-binding protein n=1 Tax=Betta splendens TaxID=158456 RepID=A0A6P7LIE8_BETSP|nr:uncharacterized protein LOC114848289 [Betta splendens]XP_028994486.1 uncharacterized protein LOC114848289 [Betta splendens]
MDFKESVTKEEGRNVAHAAPGKETQTKQTFSDHKPLSANSKMICDQKTSLQPPWNSFDYFTNFKVEIVNSCAQKRKLELSSCDDGYETPSKKVSLDSNVDDVSCLSPISTNADTAVKGSDAVISCQNKPGQKLKETHPQMEKQEKMKENTNVDEKEDKGHFSVSCTGQLPTEQQESTTDSGLYCNGSVLVLDSWDLHVGGFEEVQSISHIGPPIFESTMCCGDSGELSFKELPRASTDFIDSHHDAQEDDVGDTSTEATLPLNVKVKSVVVVPNPQTTCFKADPTVLDQNHVNLSTGEKVFESAASKHRSQRDAVVKEELTWEQQKNQYVNLVTKHINGKTENQDVMTELLSLMTQVADQAPVGDTAWQHPSNLTRRNYQRLFGFPTPKMSLQDWHTKNGAHKRFAAIPSVFKRSPLP